MAGNFDFFGLLLGASFAAGIAVLVVAAARLILKKAPKQWSYIMWIVVFFRCLCPFAAESSVSVFNALDFAETAWTSETAEADRTLENPAVNVSEAAPVTDSGYVPSVPSETVQPPASEEYIVNTENVWRDSYEPVQNDIQNVYNNQIIRNVDKQQSEQSEQPAAENSTDSRTIFIIVWLCGVGAMALYGIVSAARLAARVKTAVRTEKGIYESDRISTAFAAGLLRPKIYIPCGIPEDERRLIVMHERVHIRRRDYLFKLLAFAGLSLHWFNPLIWAAFALMTRDMEMSCDEAVLRECGESGRILYAEALLRVSVRGFGGAAVVGFGETGIKIRVKNVLNYKKPGKLAAIAAAMVMLASCTMAGTDAVTDKDNANSADSSDISTTETDMEICGQQFSFPFKADDLPDGFKIDETGHYIEATNATGFMMYYNGEEIACVYCDGKCENSSEAVITSIGFGMFIPVPEINIMGIKGSSSSDEIKQILGEPNYIQEDGNAYRYFFSNEKQLLINFTDDEKSIECLIVSYAEKTVEPKTDTVNFDITHEITGWTMEDLVNDVYLGGHKIVLPAHSNLLDPAFCLSGYYDRLFGNTVFTLSCNNEKVAFIYIDGDHSNDSDIVIDHIMFGLNRPMPELNIMGITESSSSEEVKRILGEPNYIQDDGNTYRYVFSDKKQFMVSFTDDEKAIDFYYIQYEADDMEDGEQLRQKQSSTEWLSPFLTSSKLAEQERRSQEEELRRLQQQEESKLQNLREEEDRLKKEAELRRQSEEAANAEKFSYPFSQFPVSAADLGEYGANEQHVLFAVPKGTAVLAAEDGTVKSAKRDFNIGYGLCMEISHDDEMSTFYAHLDEFAVKVGDKVKKGDVIAYSGSSGDTKGDALLFEIRRDGIYEDPRNYYSFSEDGYRRALEEIGKNYVGDGIRGIYDENGTPLYEKEQETIKVGSETYYLISTEEQLRAIASGEYGMDKNFLQKSTIQLSSDEWIPIGTKEAPFTGSYNGNGFEIIGLTITDPNATRIGMFGWTENANIYNITLRDYDIESAGGNAKRISVAPVVDNGTRCYDNHVYPAGSPESASVLVKPCPQEVKISSLYGKDNDNSEFHKGIDYMAAKGTEVYAAADGKVLVSEDQNNGYGMTIIIDHGGELATLYAHLNEALVSKGYEVKAGDLIGYSGHTGSTYGDALHFEVRENGQHVDPMNYFKF